MSISSVRLSGPFVAAVLLLAAPLPAQDLTATLKGSKATLVGDDGGATVFVSNSVVKDGEGGSSGETVVFTPNPGTTINGEGNPVTFDGVKSLSIRLGDGNDALTFTNFNFDGPVSLHAGAGVDNVHVDGSNLNGKVKCFGDGDNDNYDFDSSNFGPFKLVDKAGGLTMDCFANGFNGPVIITGGPDDDEVTFNGDSLSSKLIVSLMQGNDELSLNDTSVGLDVAVRLSTGNNTFDASDSSLGEELRYSGGSGSDVLDFQETQIGMDCKLKLGPGNNSVAMDALVQVGDFLTVKGGPQNDIMNFGIVTPGLVQVGERAVFSLAGGTNVFAQAGNMSVGSQLRIACGGQNDEVTLDGTGVGEDLFASLAGGDNLFTANEVVVSGNLKITAGSGDDTVVLTATTVEGQQIIKLGGGNNVSP
jgi:hypothetical protein